MSEKSTPPSLRCRFFVYGLLVLGVIAVSTLAAAYLKRIAVADWAIHYYLNKKNIQAQFSIQKLDWNEILITDIQVENGIHIPKLHVLRDASSSQMGQIASVDIDVASIDVWTTQKLIKQLAPEDNASDGEGPQFSDLQKYCQWLEPTNVKFHIQKLIHENTEIPLNVALEHTPKSNKTVFSFAGKNLHYALNERFQIQTDGYSGKMELECGTDKIRFSGDPVILSIIHLHSQSPKLTIKNSKLISKKMDLTLSADNRAVLHFPLQLKVTAETAAQKYVADFPRLLITSDQSLDASKKSSLFINGKNLKMSAPYSLSIAKTDLEFATTYNWSESLDGAIHIYGLTYNDAKNKPLIRNVSSKIQLQKNQETLSAVVGFSDKTKLLDIKNVHVLQTGNTITAEFDKKSTLFRLNSEIAELLPLAKEYVHTLSGTVRLGGLVSYKNAKLDGNIQLEGRDIAVTSEYGNASDVSFDHDIVSLSTLESSPSQKIRIKSLTVGKEIRRFALDYQVLNRSLIIGQKLHLEHEGAKIDARNFAIDPEQKALRDFKASIENLKLDTLLVLAVGPLITADGNLSGELNLEFEGKTPVVSGRLKSDTAGWIRYRQPGQVQQKNISLSDNPMNILNSYLYNFEYQDLDLELSSDKNYKMNVLLKAFGRNPDYLSGKPLKLKINLEQNVLAAIQSMMLSYDLPSKLKEKIEKAGN